MKLVIASSSTSVTAPDLRFEVIHHLFQRLHQLRSLHVVANKTGDRQLEYFRYGVDDHLQVGVGLVGKTQLFIIHLLRGFRDVHGVVADALEVADAVEQFGDIQAVAEGQAPAAQLYQIGAQLVLVEVHPGFHLLDFGGKLIVIFAQQADGAQKGFLGEPRHLAGEGFAALEGDCGRGQ